LSPPLRYHHRPRPFAPEAVFELTDTHLRVDQGRRSGHFPLSDLAEIRFAYKPGNATSNLFQTNLRWKASKMGGRFSNLSWKSPLDYDRLDAEYNAFAGALLAAARAANPALIVHAGVPLWRYAGVAITGVVALTALVGVAAIALGDANWPPAVIVAVLAGYFLWWLRRYLLANRPRVLGPDEPIPDALMARVSALNART